LHNRIHFGKTQSVLSAIKKAYGEKVDVDFACSESCDACAWAKAKRHPRDRVSVRKATRRGERLHFDLFISPFRSIDGKIYLLVVVDEYSKFVYVRGLAKKSELPEMMISIIREIETHLQNRVGAIEGIGGIAAVRCDNAPEHLVSELLDKYDRSGIVLETSVPHSAFQDGMAERHGGIIWHKAAALRYGGNLPNKYWLLCCLSSSHIHNRLPTSNSIDNKTPYELWHDVVVPTIDLIDHFRRMGSLCYVTTPHLTVSKPRKCYRAMMVGYAETLPVPKKGYLVIP